MAQFYSFDSGEKKAGHKEELLKRGFNLKEISQFEKIAQQAKKELKELFLSKSESAGSLTTEQQRALIVELYASVSLIVDGLIPSTERNEFLKGLKELWRMKGGDKSER